MLSDDKDDNDDKVVDCLLRHRLFIFIFARSAAQNSNLRKTTSCDWRGVTLDTPKPFPVYSLAGFLRANSFALG